MDIHIDQPYYVFFVVNSPSAAICLRGPRWIHELKIWLVAAVVPGFCYFCQAAQTQSESYHGDLVAYMRNDGSPELMNQNAQRLRIGNGTDDPLGTCDLTVYYFLHPGRN
jgi:hypothetical protein